VDAADRNRRLEAAMSAGVNSQLPFVTRRPHERADISLPTLCGVVSVERVVDDVSAMETARLATCSLSLVAEVKVCNAESVDS